MANWIYNLLHGKLPGKGFLGRSSTDSGPGELLDPAAARTLLDLHEDGEPLFARLTVGPSFKNPDIGFNADLPSLAGSGLSIVLDAGGSSTLEGGNVDISAGTGQTDGGDVTITPGGAATGTAGVINLDGDVEVTGGLSLTVYLKLPGSSVEIDGLESSSLAGSGTKLVTASLVKVISDALSSLTGNVLQLDNTTPFTPDTDYEPATKKYVDDSPPGGAASGDLSGTYPSPTVAKIQGVAISAAAPSDGQVLTYDTTNGWQPETPAGGSGYWDRTGTVLSPMTTGDLLQLSNGSVSAPPYSFGFGTNHGMFLNNAIGATCLCADGVAPLRVKSTGVETDNLTVQGDFSIPNFRLSNGSVSAPSYSFWFGTDHGMFLNNAIGATCLCADGVASLLVKSTVVEVVGTLRLSGGTTALPAITRSTDTNSGINLPGGDTLEFVTGGQARLTISGNDISIGMDTADYVGFFGGTPVVRQPELTDELTDNITAITHTDPATPDYAIQDLTDTGGFGFATKDEGNTVLAQIRELQLQVKNLRTRNIQLENTLAAYNLIVDAD